MDSAQPLTELQNWKNANDEHENKGLAWGPKRNINTRKNFDELNRVFQTKVPVKVFEVLFSKQMQKYIFQKT